MSSSLDTTVMGPALKSSDGSNPPQFITNYTNKVQYRDALETCAGIVRSLAKVYWKAAAKFYMMELIIYLACDDKTKAKLRAEETKKRLSFKVNDDDPQGIELVKHILHTISH